MDEARPIPADWLRLREPADARAREVTREAVTQLLADDRPLTIVDVGSGTGAGARWVASVLDTDPDWVLIDHDEALLRTAAAGLREAGVRGPITEVVDDLSCLGRVLDETSDSPTLVITSALLDLLTQDQLDGFLEAVGVRGVPLVAALTVTGGVDLTPADPSDEVVRTGFHAHQRHGDRLGPDAAAHAHRLAVARGLRVHQIRTPWHLDAAASREDAALIRRLVYDRADAAVEELRHRGDAAAAEQVTGWLTRRQSQTQAGDLKLSVDHLDLLIGI